DPVECGSSTARVLSGVPGRARMYRAVQLLTASATDRLWITDAYLIAPPPLYASLLDAARAGVDVRLLVPGTSDLPVLRDSTRIGYRDPLRASARHRAVVRSRAAAQALEVRARGSGRRDGAPRGGRTASRDHLDRDAPVCRHGRAAARVPTRHGNGAGRGGVLAGPGVRAVH